MKRTKKGFDYGEGNYYLTIKSHPNNITLHRKDKRAALDTYRHYKSIGKHVEWHGVWDGSQFKEAEIS